MQRIRTVNGQATLKTNGKFLVLPTGNAATLPAWNEYTLSTSRLTAAESPFGGTKGTGTPPDFAVGTISINKENGILNAGDGVYLQDKDGNNSSKTLSAGKLKEASSLTVDASAKTITEEFIISNTNIKSPGATVVDDGSLVDNWTRIYGEAWSLTTENGRIKYSATADAAGKSRITKVFGNAFLNAKFVKMTLESTVEGTVFFEFKDSTNSLSVTWRLARFPIAANTPTTFVFPFLAPAGTTGMSPYSRSSGTYDYSNIRLYLGIDTPVGTVFTFYVDDIIADPGTPVYLEMDAPDYLGEPSLTVQCWDSLATPAAYATSRVSKLDSVWSDTSATPANFKTLDGMKFDDLYGAGLGRAVFPKRAAGALNVSGSSGAINYSANSGTSKRIGIRVDLPPSDGRTSINKIKLKLILTYSDTSGNVIPDVSGNDKPGTLNFCRKGINYLDMGSDFGWIMSTFTTGLISTNFKINCTFKVNSTTAAEAGIFTPSNAMAARYIQILINTTNLNVLISNGTNYTITNIGTVAAGTVYNLEVSYNNGAVSGTLNGTPFNFTPTYQIPSPIVTGGTTPVRIGGNPSFPATKLDGYIYNVKFQNLPTGTGFEYIPAAVNAGSTTYEFNNSSDLSYGLQNLIKPWVAVYDPLKSVIDVIVFTRRPTALSRKRDDSGEIYEVSFTTQGPAYHYQITHYNPALDSDSDLIPNTLEEAVEGSIAKLLAARSWTPDYFDEYDLSTSAIQGNDFSITAASLDIIPFAVSEGAKVTTSGNVSIPVSETISTQTGNVSIMDVRGQAAARVRKAGALIGGDCKVWDTAGQAQEANWVRVYSPDWVFSGEKIIENGIIRIKFGASNTYIYLYYNGAYNLVSVSTSKIGTTYSTMHNPTFVSISPDVIDVNYTQPNTNSGKIILRKGLNSIKWGTAAGSTNKMEGSDPAYRSRFSFGSIGIKDAVFETQDAIIQISQGYYSALISPTLNHISFICATTGNSSAYTMSSKFSTIYLNPTSVYGAIPTDCSKLFYEAEACTGIDGTITADTDASGGSCMSASVQYIKIFGKTVNLPPGTYSIYYRLKASSATDPRVTIYARKPPYASGADNLAILSINPATTYGYHKLDITIAQTTDVRILAEKGLPSETTVFCDYVLIVPTGLIEKYAKRSLWNPAPGTKSLKEGGR